MALNGFPRDIQAFDAIRIDSPLRQPFRIGNMLCLGVEDLYEIATDELALLLGIRDSFQIRKELFAGIHADNVQAEIGIGIHYLMELVFAKHPVVDKNTSQILPDSLVQ